MENNRAFDKDEVLKRFDEDKDFLSELVEIFINDAPEQLSEIQKAVDSHNDEEIQKSAHKLKGAISNFEEKEAYEVALKIETMGRNNRLDGVEEAYDTLVKEVEYLLNALREFVE